MSFPATINFNSHFTINVPYHKYNNLFSYFESKQPSIFIIITTTIVLSLLFENGNCEHLGEKQNHQFGRKLVDHTQYNNYDFDKIFSSSENTLETYYSNDDQQIINSKLSDLSEPTPPLKLAHIASYRSRQQTSRNGELNNEFDQPSLPTQKNYLLFGSHHNELIDKNSISPSKVLRARYRTHKSDNYLFSPIFNFQTVGFSDQIAPINYAYQDASNNIKRIYQRDAQFPQNSLLDSSNALDFLEPGSGDSPPGWDGRSEETTKMIEDSTNLMEELDSTILPTSVMSSISHEQLATPSSNNRYNRPPMLNRRLPKLSATAGQLWKFTVPFDTFTDEDGDLRQLRSSLYFRRPVGSATVKQSDNQLDMSFNVASNSRDSVGQYFSWLQYNQKTQLLYGFPTESEAGKHELVLVVSDRWGGTSEELVEIHVKQHQSTRAFTHLFVVNQITWDRLGFPSVVDALCEFIKRLSADVYHDSTFKNIILQYYKVDNRNHAAASNSSEQVNNYPVDMQNRQTNTTMSFTLAWSNSSIPVQPCNMGQIEDVFRYLIEPRAKSIAGEWPSSDKLVDQTPSQGLINASGNEFKPTSVSIYLQGACERLEQRSSENNHVQNAITDALVKVKTKIGKITWQLGEPIEYRIPRDTFETEGGKLGSRDLKLTVHTIDGLAFDKDPKYSFLEFDQESQTLYGLPYDQTDHAGQKEIQLTARHPKSGSKVHEVFILNIEPQELTVINNRAFRMSLYLAPRSGLFGPRERVLLSHKVAGALRSSNKEFHTNRENAEFIVMNIRKFALTSSSLDNNDGSHSDIPSYQDKIVRVADGSGDQSDDFYKPSKELTSSKEGSISPGNYFYKYTWTNGTIGYRGDCPVEVIKENIIGALEQSMLEIRFPEAVLIEESSKNDSARFFGRLRSYFEPESELIHLRFEPMGACVSALELHDIGNSEIADYADRASDLPLEAEEIYLTINSPPATQKPTSDPSSDEYWSIVVLMILVVALIFVIIMFFMGMHTYKINQDKRFELQVKLAQARQNSMYLSSIMLANQAGPNDMCIIAPEVTKSMYVVQDEERGSRKPVILDNEKQLLTSIQRGPVGMKPTAVQLSGQVIHTMPLKSNMTFTLDSIASTLQPSLNTVNLSPSTMINSYLDDKHRSMTLNRKPNNFNHQRFPGQIPNNIQHSQSILTVASLATPLPIIHQGRLPY